MDSRRPSYSVNWPRVHSAGLPLPPPLIATMSSPTGLPPSLPTGVLAYTVGWSHHRSWASTSSPTGLPLPPPTGVSADTASLLCRRWIQIQMCIIGIHGFKLISYASGMDQSEHYHRRLVCRRLVSSPPRLAYYAAIVGRLRLHQPAASSATDWCFRLHSWLIMPPLLGVYFFTDRPPRPPSTGAFACTAGLLCSRCWASTSSLTGRLIRRRLVFMPARLAYYAAVVGRLRLHRPAASSAVDYCFRLHGWPIMPPLLGIYVFIDRPRRPPPTGAFACTDGLLCRRCWASTSSPPACLRRRRLVSPLARLDYYAAVVGRLHLHRPAASYDANWCYRLHGWPRRRHD
uniref:cysteine dioxygenase n=1 Tax=Oryza sativa subsp. japonica TaxID=39947 RepID=Q6K440_ORYSJ|nr:HGWP repeat containing protein-like [Oryza sativa Japonica Group]